FVTTSEIFFSCDKTPDTAVTIRVVLPTAAFELAEKVKSCCPPGLNENAEGLAATPAGNPPTAMFTCPANPLMAWMLMVAFVDPPCATEELLGAVMEKSGRSFGGCD